MSLTNRPTSLLNCERGDLRRRARDVSEVSFPFPARRALLAAPRGLGLWRRHTAGNGELQSGQLYGLLPRGRLSSRHHRDLLWGGGAGLCRLRRRAAMCGGLLRDGPAMQREQLPLRMLPGWGVLAGGGQRRLRWRRADLPGLWRWRGLFCAELCRLLELQCHQLSLRLLRQRGLSAWHGTGRVR